MERVLEQCNVDSHMYNFTNELFLDSWIKTTYYFEAPMNHKGTLGLFYLNKCASEKIKVMLCGEGADETMAGYYRFYDILMYKTNIKYRSRRIVGQLLRRHLNLRKDWDEMFIRETQFVRDTEVRRIYGKSEVRRVINQRMAFIKKQ